MNAPTLTRAPLLLSPLEAAECLGVSRRFVYRKIRTQELPFFRLGDSPSARLRIDVDDLHAWLEGIKESNSVTEQLCQP